MGPSTGSGFVLESSLSDSDLGGASARSASNVSCFFASGNILDNPEFEDDKSMTPRWINKEGRTLSVNTGMVDVSGMGKGAGEVDPKRTVMAWIRKRAFLKQ